MRSAAAHQALLLQQLLPVGRRSYVAAGRPSVGFPRSRPVRFPRPPSSSPVTPVSFRPTLAAGYAQRLLVTSVFPTAPRSGRRFSDGVGVRAAQVNDPGAIDSPLMQAMEKKIKEQLNADIVVVKDAYGDGRHVSIDVVSSAFEGQSAVNRQRMVYKAIWEELQSTVHAVDQMTTKTPAEVGGNK